MADQKRVEGEEAVHEDAPSRAGESVWGPQPDHDRRQTPRKRSGLADMLWGEDERPIVGVPPSER